MLAYLRASRMCRVTLILVFFLLPTAPATAEFQVRKSGDDVWINLLFIKGWPIEIVKMVFAPNGERIHFVIPVSPDDPSDPDVTPIRPWCDCPEEYEFQLIQTLRQFGIYDPWNHP